MQLRFEVTGRRTRNTCGFKSIVSPKSIIVPAMCTSCFSPAMFRCGCCFLLFVGVLPMCCPRPSWTYTECILIKGRGSLFGSTIRYTFSIRKKTAPVLVVFSVFGCDEDVDGGGGGGSGQSVRCHLGGMMQHCKGVSVVPAAHNSLYV